MVVIQPSAALDCADCVREVAGGGGGGAPLVLVPPALADTALLRLLEPYRRYRLWRLSLEGVGHPARAWGGFADGAAAAAFNKRMAHVPTEFCCRWGGGGG